MHRDKLGQLPPEINLCLGEVLEFSRSLTEEADRSCALLAGSLWTASSRSS